MKSLVVFGSVIALALGLVGCGEAARKIKYAAYEKIGVEKRDLFERNVKRARNDQKEASKQFESALDRLRKMHNINGGELEKTYDRLKSDYDKCEKRADDVHKSVDSVETVSQDLFKEWESEIATMQNADLQTKSKQELAQTETRYAQMITTLRKAEQSMTPVLQAFKDHVLYLKHNLNAKAIQSLEGESTKIQTDIQSLIQDMNKSIKEADEFMASFRE